MSTLIYLTQTTHQRLDLPPSHPLPHHPLHPAQGHDAPGSDPQILGSSDKPPQTSFPQDCVAVCTVNEAAHTATHKSMATKDSDQKIAYHINRRHLLLNTKQQ